MISLEKLKIFTPKVGDLGKTIVTKALKTCPKSNKLSNLVTLAVPIPRPYLYIGIRPTLYRYTVKRHYVGRRYDTLSCIKQHRFV